MSDSIETLIVCPDQDSELVERMTIAFGVLSLFGAVITYFVQQAQDRAAAKEEKEKEDANLDREHALARTREQLSVLIGPLHRAYKTFNTVSVQWKIASGHGLGSMFKVVNEKGAAYWHTIYDEEYFEKRNFYKNPHSFEAVKYRNFVSRRLKPMYTKVRELVLAHSELADMPSQEEWLGCYTEDDVKSPYVGSVNINVMFDTFSVWTLEFDDIIESWEQEDFRRMQPETKVCFLICNDLVDMLYDTAKAKEAKYNKHVKVHKNVVQESLFEQIKSGSLERVAKLDFTGAPKR